jgi:hypothetical protein
MKFAKIVFLVAGIWGVLLLAPLYFLFDMIGTRDPPPITHPAFFYGFAGLGLAWQVAFFVIARDPLRFRPIMIPSILEKLGSICCSRHCSRPRLSCSAAPRVNLFLPQRHPRSGA